MDRFTDFVAADHAFTLKFAERISCPPGGRASRGTHAGSCWRVRQGTTTALAARLETSAPAAAPRYSPVGRVILSVPM
jgi:hypothetical protein